MPNHKSEDYKLSAVDYYLTLENDQKYFVAVVKNSYTFHDVL